MAIDKKLMGEAIQRIRKHRGLTQAQLAEAAGLSSGGNSVALIERGVRGVSLDTLESLASVLDVPAGCLLILGRRASRRSESFRDLLTTGQKLIMKLVELHSVLKTEEVDGTFTPTRTKRNTRKKGNRTSAIKSGRKARKQSAA